MRITKDLVSGLMFLTFGIGAAVIAHGYTLGTLTKMGSGFFPIVIAVLIAILGLIIAVRAILEPDSSELVARVEFRPIFFISLALILFGLLADDFGLVAALTALIIIARLAGREGSLIELAIMVVSLIAVVVAVFVYALNIHLALWPS
jgi:putative tricarboxylic transport membrane protein